MSERLGTTFNKSYVSIMDAKGKEVIGIKDFGGYKDKAEFALSIMREFNTLKSRETLLRKARSIGNNKAITTITAHYDAIQANIEKLFDFFQAHVSSEYMAGALPEEAITTVLREMSGMITAAIRQAERSHPLGIITAGIDNAVMNV
jgi:hypothetical protein